MKNNHDLMQYIIRYDPNAISVMDKDMKYIYVSERFLDDYRLSEDEIIGKHHYEVFPDLPEKWRESHRLALQGKVTRSDDDFFVRSDGTIEYTAWECRPWYVQDGSIGGIVLYTEVKTKRKQIERALRESNIRYQSLFDHSPVVIWEEDLTELKKYMDKLKKEHENVEAYLTENPQEITECLSRIKVIDVNEYSVEFYGAKSKRDLIDNMDKLFTPVAIKSMFNFLVYLNQGKTYFRDNHETNTFGKGIKDVIIEISIPEPYRHTWERAYVTTMDITLLKKTEKALSESELKFRTLFEQQLAMQLIIEPESGKIMDANKAAADFYGWSVQELKKMNISQINTLSSQEIRNEMERAKKSQKTYFEFCHRKADSSHVEVEVFSSLININGKDYLHSIIHDVTEKKKAQREIIVAKDKAQAANKAKSQFLANMSHELRTPLNGIIGFGELLKDTDINETQREYVKIITDSGDSLLRLINDILDFSKIEAKKLELYPQEVDLHELIKNSTQLIKHKAIEKGIDLSLSIKEDVPKVVRVDIARLKQILINLLGNAVKFTDKGHVNFRVSTSSIDTARQKVTLLFSIEDTGIGIKDKNKVKIFEAFNQEDCSITRRFGGTGLGLTITNNLLTMMDSSLAFESEAGKGSTFFFQLTLDYLKG